MKIRSHRPFPMCLALLCLAAVPFVACSVEVPDPPATAPNADAPAKGGGSKGSDAQSSGQKGGSKAAASKGTAQSQGAENGGLVCDASTESIGWCADDASIVFCSADTWWLLDCRQLDPDAFCGYDDELNIVDCYVLDDWDVCLDLDEACVDDAECCSGLCDESGACDDGGDECEDFGEACVDDTDCCSYICAEDGTCG